ncbi:MAG TPA: glycosyltransferase family 4 protein [Candidatus Wunengus sp. YC61]|uniref:glycosyltransferase family 4 protein n=1 Tax=Candidatus Wunengus sp. YC61 TaxID=3367698 RepID=UPI0040280141
MLTVGVVLDSIITAGGGFQQSLSTILLLNDNKEKYKFIYFTTHDENISTLSRYGIKVVPIELSTYEKAIIILRRNNLIRRFFEKMPLLGNNSFDQLFKRYNIDLLYFTSYSKYARYTEEFNYILTVWDLNHRDYPEFPHFHKDNFFNNMESLLSNILPKATAILVDSPIGKVNTVKRYGLDEQRVHVLPFLPAESVLRHSDDAIDIKARYSLKRDYIFYPAQFWAHKNHFYIIEGLKVLKDKYGVVVDAVFSGTDKGNLSHIMKSACECGVKDQVHYLGFVDNEEIPELYLNALALVMPTYFGPTNIPPLEAFVLNCPVLCADLEGIRDQVSGAALLMDLKDPESLAIQLLKVINGDPIVEKKRQKGMEIIKSWTKEDYWQKVDGILKDYQTLMKCWKF